VPYPLLVGLELALAVATVIGLCFVTAPYGRFRRSGWGPTLPARVAWVVMESPAPLLFAVVYATGAHRAHPVPLTLLALWQSHYLYRTFAYPFLIRGSGRLPVAVVLLAIGFNVLNASVNAWWV
jgi:hypothetical protein